MPEMPETRFTKAGDIDIAYQVIGRTDGLDLVFVLGERALLEGGRRTATLRAVTDCVIATAAQDQIDRGSLSSLAELHHREDPDR